MLVVRCKNCNREIVSNTKTQVCGCPNMMTVRDDSVTAVDLSKVVMLNSQKSNNKTSVLTSEDIAWQEQRRKRKVRKLDFEIKSVLKNTESIKKYCIIYIHIYLKY